jgi:hypothetical protein
MLAGRMTRRYLLELTAAQLPLASRQVGRSTPPYPFVDGLTIPSRTPDPLAFSQSGLCGVVFYISQATVVTRPDAVNWIRLYTDSLGDLEPCT